MLKCRGWTDWISSKINAFASNARCDGFFPDRQRVRSYAARAGAGAIDFVTKPQLGIREGMLAYSEMIAEKVRTAAKASLAAHKPLSVPTTLKAGPLLSSEKLIAIGASTGGTEAIRHVLQPLPLSSPALLITQHMPPGFTRSFADRLNKLCQIGVKEAEDGARLAGTCLYRAGRSAYGAGA